MSDKYRDIIRRAEDKKKKRQDPVQQAINNPTLEPYADREFEQFAQEYGLTGQRVRWRDR